VAGAHEEVVLCLFGTLRTYMTPYTYVASAKTP
jgi:hypothetical protein